MGSARRGAEGSDFDPCGHVIGSENLITGRRHWQLVGDAQTRWTSPLADPSSNELHGEGEVCVRCGALIRAGQPVRRMIYGPFQHEDCSQSA
jgi:hypothetical protein